MKCPPFWDKLEAELEKGNPEVLGICALMSKNSITQAKNYLAFRRDFCERYGIEREVVSMNVPMSAAKTVWRFKKGSPVYLEATGKMAKLLKEKKRITIPIMNKLLDISPRDIAAKDPDTIKIPVSQKITLTNKANPLSSNEFHLSALTSQVPGQSVILQRVMQKYHLDSEYAAFCKMFVIVNGMMELSEPNGMATEGATS